MKWIWRLEVTLHFLEIVFSVQVYNLEYERRLSSVLIILVEEAEGRGTLMIVSLGALAVFFMAAAVVLAVKIRQLQRGTAGLLFDAHPGQWSLTNQLSFVM